MHAFRMPLQLARRRCVRAGWSWGSLVVSCACTRVPERSRTPSCALGGSEPMQVRIAAPLSKSFPARHRVARWGQPASGRHCLSAASGTWMLASRRSRCRKVCGSRGKTSIWAQPARITCVRGAPPGPRLAPELALDAAPPVPAPVGGCGGAAGRCESRLSSTAVICMEPCNFCFGAATVDPSTPEMFVRAPWSTCVPERGRSATEGRPKLPAARMRSSGSGTSNARLPRRGISMRSSTCSRGQAESKRRIATSLSALQPRRTSFWRCSPMPLERTSAKRTVVPAGSSLNADKSNEVRMECLATRLTILSGSNDTPRTLELKRRAVCFPS
mmetsp:Transcript_56018/g.166628  ORF Transcript_56018/g.166628 Transcript_56018/m.166628 type:complete len:330 (+) Transcript_56018:822-1811(+)